MTLKSSRMIKKNEERQEGTFTSSNSRSLSAEEARYLGSFLPICLSLFTVSLSVKYPILSQDAIFCAEEMEHIHSTRGYFIAESGAQHNIHTATRYFIALTVSMYNSTQLNSAKCWTCKQVHKKKWSLYESAHVLFRGTLQFLGLKSDIQCTRNVIFFFHFLLSYLKRNSP